MATVYVGSASIDENGNAHGGKAGNQTGKELKKQAWYLHSKGWRVFRALDEAKAKLIAACMAAAIANRHIGYDQYQRNTLYTQAGKVGFDVSKVTVDCETDCSALVRVCCAFAGILGLPSDFRTGNMPANLLATGQFQELTASKYTTQSAYLRSGDILVTRTSGHTVVVLSDGASAKRTEGASAAAVSIDGLGKGDYGSAVTAMQRALLAWDAHCLPKYGVDGDFGSETEKAVKAYQQAAGLPVTGVYDEATRAALTSIGAAKQVRIIGGTVNVRSVPGTTGRILGVVARGTLLPWQSESQDVSGTPWHRVAYKDQSAWVSGKYSEVISK